MSEDELPPNMRPAPLECAKGIHELVPGSMLGKRLDRIIVLCFTCKKPLYVLYPNDLDKPALPLGDFKAPTHCDQPCPLCQGVFARYNDTLKCAQYLTNLGVV